MREEEPEEEEEEKPEPRPVGKCQGCARRGVTTWIYSFEGFCGICEPWKL